MISVVVIGLRSAGISCELGTLSSLTKPVQDGRARPDLNLKRRHSSVVTRCTESVGRELVHAPRLGIEDALAAVRDSDGSPARAEPFLQLYVSREASRCADARPTRDDVDPSHVVVRPMNIVDRTTACDVLDLRADRGTARSAEIYHYDANGQRNRTAREPCSRPSAHWLPPTARVRPPAKSSSSWLSVTNCSHSGCVDKPSR